MTSTEIQILIIDNNDSDVALLSECLAGYDAPVSITHVRAAEEAVPKLKTHKFDICILDIHLPGLGGLEFIRHVLDHGDNLPTVIITDRGDEKTAVRAMKLGAYDYLLKGEVGARLLNKTVYRAIEDHRVKQEKSRLEEERKIYTEMLEEIVDERTKELRYLMDYQQLILANLEEYIRVVDPIKKIVQYESPKMKAVFGDNVGTTCHGLLGKSEECERCVSKEAIEEWTVKSKEEAAGDKIYAISAIPFKNQDGSSSVIEVIRDITDHKKADEEREDLLHQVTERVKELNCLYEVMRIIAESKGSMADILGQIVKIIPPSWQYPEDTCARITLGEKKFSTDRFRTTKWKLTSDIFCSGKKLGTIEVCYRKKKPDSGEGPFLKEERALIDAISRQIGNLTERRRAEEELNQKRRLAAMGEMSAHLAHEIRAPLNTVGLSYHVLKESPDVEGDDRESLDIMGKGLETLLSIANDLLDFSRRDELNLDPVEPGRVISNVLSDLERTMKKNIRIKKYLHCDGIILEMDVLKINHVLTNVMSNAVQAMPKGGTLTVRTGAESDRLTISIADTGCGISEENLENIFVPFFTTKKEGTGLGMPIVKHFVELHRGEIGVTSDEGKGTEVTIFLPMKR